MCHSQALGDGDTRTILAPTYDRKFSMCGDFGAIVEHDLASLLAAGIVSSACLALLSFLYFPRLGRAHQLVIDPAGFRIVQRERAAREFVAAGTPIKLLMMP